MKLTAIASITLLSLPFTNLTRAEAPIFAPEEDSQLTVTFEQRSESELVEIEASFILNGDEQGSMEPDDIEIERTFSESISFTDQFTKVEDGVPAHVLRIFDTISSTSTEEYTDEEGEEGESETERTSELVGLSILFTWDSDEEQYEKSFDEEEDADEDLLDKLEFTGYLVGLLPDDEISEGDEWQVEAEVFRKLIYPGGVLSYVEADHDHDDEDEDEDAIAKQLDWEEQYGENFTGEITLEHLGMREDDDGVEQLVIGIDIMVETFVEQEEEIGVTINEEEGEGTQTKTFTYTTSMTGELLWDLEQGRAVSLTLSGDHSSEFVEARDMAAGGVQIETTDTRLFEGERTIEYTIE